MIKIKAIVVLLVAFVAFVVSANAVAIVAHVSPYGALVAAAVVFPTAVYGVVRLQTAIL